MMLDPTKSAVNELDDLFGSIKVTSDSKANIPLSSNQNEVDDCLPLFPTSTNKSNISIFSDEIFLFIIIADTNESTTTKKGGLFDDLQDLLVDQSTGQKISLTKRYKKSDRIFRLSKKYFILKLISIKQFQYK